MKPVGLPRFIPWWPLLIILLVTLIWVGRVVILSWILNHTVEIGNIQNLKITPSILNPDHAQIEHLSFDIVLEDHVYHIQGSNLELNYDPGMLWSGRVDQMVIGHLAVKQISNSAAGNDFRVPVEAGFANALSVIEQLTGLSLPLNFLQIHDLDLALAGPPIVLDNASLEVSQEAKHIAARLEHAGQRSELEVNQDRLAFRIFPVDRSPVDPLILIVEAQNGGLELTGEFKLATLNSLLDAWFDVTVGNDNSELLETSMEFNLLVKTEQSGLLTKVELQTDDVSYQTFLAKNVSVVAQLLIDDDWLSEITATSFNRIKLESGVEIYAQSLRSGNLNVSEVKLSPRGIIDLTDSEINLTLNKNSDLTIENLHLQGFQIRHLTAVPALTLSDSIISPLPGFRLQASQISDGEIQLNQPELNALEKSTIILDADDGFRVGKGRWKLHSELDVGQHKRVTGTMILEVNHFDSASYEVLVTMESPLLSPAFNLPALEKVSASIVGRGSVLAASGELTLQQNDIALNFRLNHQADQASGQFSAQTLNSINIIDALTITESAGITLPDGLKITTGNLGLEAQLMWDRNQSTATSMIRAKNLAGSWEGASFSELSLDGEFEILPEFSSQGAVDVKAENLNYGVELNDLAAILRIFPSPNGELPALHIGSLQGGLLGGRFVTGDFSVDLNQPETSFDVAIKNLDIEQVVNIQGIEGLEATGHLDGLLPVELSSGGITVTEGTLWNPGNGGKIAYAISDQQAASFSNPLTDVVIAALKDYRYDVLTAAINYHPDGDLFINFHLEGISPEVDPKRPLHLNINSEQNVISLLRSLTYSEGLSKTLDTQIRENFK